MCHIAGILASKASLTESKGTATQAAFWYLMAGVFPQSQCIEQKPITQAVTLAHTEADIALPREVEKGSPMYRPVTYGLLARVTAWVYEVSKAAYKSQEEEVARIALSLETVTRQALESNTEATTARVLTEMRHLTTLMDSLQKKTQQIRARRHALKVTVDARVEDGHEATLGTAKVHELEAEELCIAAPQTEAQDEESQHNRVDGEREQAVIIAEATADAF